MPHMTLRPTSDRFRPFSRLVCRHNWNVAVEKEFCIRGTAGLQLRSEFINCLNQPQFDEVLHGMASETFAKITNTANRGRQIQLLLRLRW